MNHRSHKTWRVAALLIVGAIVFGSARWTCADERVPSDDQQRAASQTPRNDQPLSGLDGNHFMRRLPSTSQQLDGHPRTIQFGETRQLYGASPRVSNSERRSYERGSIVSWNHDPANQSKSVQLLARQDELPEAVPANDELVTLHLNEVSVRQALEMLSRSHGLSILVAPGVQGTVTANLEGLQVDEALDALIKLANLVAHCERGLIYVYSATEFPQENFQLHVFPLDFVSATDVLPVIANLLTPTGLATASSLSPTDNTKAREAVIVTDRPEVLERVESFIRQVDRPPLQVMIEAHVLQVELSDDLKHGINYQHAMDMLGNTGLEFQMTGLADPNASPAIFARIAGAKIDGLLHILKTTTDAKTLASPRVMVINGQKARIQVGEQIPYQVVTASENFSVNDVRFLSVGVVLEVTPRISQDGRVMLRVKPKVSSGTFNSETKLPGETTREVESDVLLDDGLGLVIGGLIQEEDVETQFKLPYFGDLRYVGRLFQRRTVKKKRSEIVITLVPRICYSAESTSALDAVDAERSQTPLFHGALHRFPRPWEPQLPDAICNPITVRGGYGPGRCRGCQHQPCDCHPMPPVNGAYKPVPVTFEPIEASVPVPEQIVLPTETQSATSRRGPSPVYIGPVSTETEGSPRVIAESYSPIPRIEP